MFEDIELFVDGKGGREPIIATEACTVAKRAYELVSRVR